MDTSLLYYIISYEYELPPCARHRHTGQVTYPECQTPEYQSSCCMVNLVKGQGRQEDSTSASKTP